MTGEIAAVRSMTAGGDGDHWRGLATRFGTPLLAFDAEQLAAQYRLLSACLPDVDIHYAIKALPEAAVIAELARLGSGFDVASAGEADLLREVGVPGRRAIHTHPVKTDAEIRAALRFGATTLVVDNVEELEKLVPYRRRVGVLVRMAYASGGALVDLSRKFGCAPEEVPLIVAAARRHGLHVKGLSFHVGSQCADSRAHVEAIGVAAQLMHMLSTEVPMSVLDIGGGFPVDYAGRTPVNLTAFCAPIARALAGLPRDWQLIAEPGRCLVAGAVTGVFSVIGRSVRGGRPWYFIDDGLYGAFSGQVFDGVRYPLQVLSDAPLAASVLAGPTCDSIDVVAEDVMLPRLEIGDLVIGHQMGAYTCATSTRFNLLRSARFVDVRADRAGDELAAGPAVPLRRA